MRLFHRCAAALLLLGGASSPLLAQAPGRALPAAIDRALRDRPHAGLPDARGATALLELLDGLNVTTRVLVIGAHPDDEDTGLITWLSRGHHVETAYLSLTRGDGGQNLIGNELGEALGAIRTEELLAARRVDGGKQFFTRAYDFGFSKDSAETFRHWPRDTILGDMVRIVRAFRPQVIVSVFSGTSRDGHGHHQVSGLLSRVVFDAAADTVRFPRQTFGAPWTPSKFYRSAAFDPTGGTLHYNVGDYDPVFGRGYAEIAAESRSQHRSQAFGSLQKKGVRISGIRREVTRVNAATPATSEHSIFDGIDTSLTRFGAAACVYPAAAVEALRVAITRAQQTFDVRHPDRSISALVELHKGLDAVRSNEERAGTAHSAGTSTSCRDDDIADAHRSFDALSWRAEQALLLAAGIAFEALAPREAMASAVVPVRVTTYNRGPESIRVSVVRDREGVATGAEIQKSGDASVLPDSAVTIETVTDAGMAQPVWLRQPRLGDWFALPVSMAIPPVDSLSVQRLDAETARLDPQVLMSIGIRDIVIPARVNVMYRHADPVKGDLSRPIAGVPAVSVTLDEYAGYVRAGVATTRELRVTLRSADSASRSATVSLALPAGLTSDSSARTVVLPGYDAIRTITFKVSGILGAGRHRIAVHVVSGGQTFAAGYQLIDYDHIRPIHLFRDAAMDLEAVNVELPAEAHIAYIQGVGDNSAPVLRQLGLPVTMLDAAAIPATNLKQFSAIVVGPRAYESNEALVANNHLLLEYVKAGGTMVTQYGQTEMQKPGILPFPITLSRPADRVTDEAGPVTILDPSARVLNMPNRITAADFTGWVQDRSVYMPRTFDAHYAAPLSAHDPGEPDNRGLILVAPYGRGTYVYTTLAFFRQLPAAVPGAASLFVNLLDAKP